ncbi:MAG TPA: hypothetical protein DEH78_23075 [Solibacterales bacterium]|nr:hypothetical protein [Bryobacterales bacterium]
MRLSVDATPLLIRSAGVKNYLYHWLRALRGAMAPGDELSLFPCIDTVGSLHHEASVSSRMRTMRSIAALHFSNKLGRIPRWIEAPSDVFHVTSQLRAHTQAAAVTATVYDLTTEVCPDLHLEATIHAEARYHRKVLAKAAGIIAISAHTKRDAIERLRLEPSRVWVIYPGIVQEFFDAKPAGDEWLAAHGLRKPFVLCLGTIEPRKNTERLLNSWDRLPASLRDEFELVVAGSPGWKSEAVLHRLRNGGGSVRYLGYVPEGDLPALIASATAVAYPSLYEGFGFPAVQAMACGVPLLTSNVSCLPEVCGEAAVYADPRSEAEISARLADVLTSPSLRGALAERGRQQAARYTWDRCAAESLEFFRAVAG